ncbi:MAG: type II secretion system minor pseudopilin GspI [Coxiellaceae bacterium]|nr:type II secretion system minor pseudopilin GspI [Coxiellaceae bacterium]
MKKNKGFTLIEVLIALIIIAVALAAAIRATTASTYATMHLRNTITAHWVGMNVLSEVQSGILVISKDNEIPPGKTEMLNKTWHWVVNTTSSEDLPSIVKITVTVSDDEKHAVTTVTGYAKE